MCVILGSGEYTSGFVLVLNFWMALEWLVQPPCLPSELVRAPRVITLDEGTRLTLLLHVSWSILALERATMDAIKLAFESGWSRCESAQHCRIAQRNVSHADSIDF